MKTAGLAAREAIVHLVGGLFACLRQFNKFLLYGGFLRPLRQLSIADGLLAIIIGVRHLKRIALGGVSWVSSADPYCRHAGTIGNLGIASNVLVRRYAASAQDNPSPVNYSNVAASKPTLARVIERRDQSATRISSGTFSTLAIALQAATVPLRRPLSRSEI